MLCITHNTTQSEAGEAKLHLPCAAGVPIPVCLSLSSSKPAIDSFQGEPNQFKSNCDAIQTTLLLYWIEACYFYPTSAYLS